MSRWFRTSCVLVTLVACSSARGAAYRFEPLAERQRATTPLVAFKRLPAINDNGTVAFLVPRNTAPTPFDEIIYTGTPGDVRVVETPGVVATGGVSINSAGRIAFIGGRPGGTAGAFAVSPGGPVATITEIGLLRPETGISDNGTVIAISDPETPAFTPGSVVVGDGTAPAQTVFRPPTTYLGQPLRSTSMFNARMSRTGDWVVQEIGNSGPAYQALHTNFRSIYSGPLNDFGPGTADVAGNGVLVYQGTLPGDTTAKLYLSRAGGTSEAIPGSEGLGASNVAVNDDGVIALLSGGNSEADGTLLRLFQGGAVETVLAAGDPLLGSTVSTIGFDPKGFNNAEQFALLVGLADGRDVFVLASPVPEPGMLGAVGTALALRVLKRRRAR